MGPACQHAHGANALFFTHPTTMTAEDRLNEVAVLLAAGVKRVLQMQKTEKIPLDNSPKTRPYVRKTNRNGERT